MVVFLDTVCNVVLGYFSSMCVMYRHFKKYGYQGIVGLLILGQHSCNMLGLSVQYNATVI